MLSLRQQTTSKRDAVVVVCLVFGGWWWCGWWWCGWVGGWVGVWWGCVVGGWVCWGGGGARVRQSRTQQRAPHQGTPGRKAAQGSDATGELPAMRSGPGQAAVTASPCGGHPWHSPCRRAWMWVPAPTRQSHPPWPPPPGSSTGGCSRLAHGEQGGGRDGGQRVWHVGKERAARGDHWVASRDPHRFRPQTSGLARSCQPTHQSARPRPRCRFRPAAACPLAAPGRRCHLQGGKRNATRRRRRGEEAPAQQHSPAARLRASQHRRARGCAPPAIWRPQ